MTDLDALARQILRHNRRGARSPLRRRGSAAALATALRARPSPSGTRDDRFVRVTRSNPCPVCGKPDFCRVARDGATVLCQRVTSGRVGADALAEFYVHHVDGRTVAAVAARAPAPLAVVAERATPAVRDLAYRALLSALPLDAADRDALTARGLAAEDIARGGYRTLAVEGRARLARVILEAVGEEHGRAVPGIVRLEDGDRAWWSLGGAAGLVIPVRDAEGFVVAVKLRARDARDGARYTSMTSARPARDGRPAYNGPSAEAALHVPVRAREILDGADPADLFVTEGELKADVVTALRGAPCVSVPGVGSWRMALAAVTRWRPRRVVVAFDADRAVNPAVARAQTELVGALRADGVRVAVATWDPRFKGLDDCLAARAAGSKDGAS